MNEDPEYEQGTKQYRKDLLNYVKTNKKSEWQTITNNIDGKYSDGIFILKEGELEDYTQSNSKLKGKVLYAPFGQPAKPDQQRPSLPLPALNGKAPCCSFRSLTTSETINPSSPQKKPKKNQPTALRPLFLAIAIVISPKIKLIIRNSTIPSPLVKSEHGEHHVIVNEVDQHRRIQRVCLPAGPTHQHPGYQEIRS